jgi:hypothetical protein
MYSGETAYSQRTASSTTETTKMYVTLLLLGIGQHVSSCDARPRISSYMTLVLLRCILRSSHLDVEYINCAALYWKIPANTPKPSPRPQPWLPSLSQPSSSFRVWSPLDTRHLSSRVTLSMLDPSHGSLLKGPSAVGKLIMARVQSPPAKRFRCE